MHNRRGARPFISITPLFICRGGVRVRPYSVDYRQAGPQKCKQIVSSSALLRPKVKQAQDICNSRFPKWDKKKQFVASVDIGDEWPDLRLTGNGIPRDLSLSSRAILANNSRSSVSGLTGQSPV